MNQIFFWSTRETHGFLSNFYPSKITLSGRVWPTVEHFYQAMKTLDYGAQEFVRTSKTPGIAKRRGQQLELRKDWEDIKYKIMKMALYAKFSHDPLRFMLLETGDSEIYEDSPNDKIWGTGAKGKVGTGQNLLGKALMETRARLYAEPYWPPGETQNVP